MGLQKLNGAVYSNCSIYHPDGTLMCRCSRKKINWYLKKGLAIPLNENDIQLEFEPGGKGWDGRSYYLEEREDKCVVCGCTENLTKHHVVPYQYRKHMDGVRKNHSHFDVLCVCIDCHDKYETHATILNKELAKKFGIDFCSPMTQSEKIAIKANSYLSALKKYSHKIPKNRVENMLGLISSWLGCEVKLDNIDKIVIEVPPKNNQLPGKKIFDSWMKENSLQNFVVMWRNHFVEKTNPKYLSECWIKEYKTTIY